MVHRRSVTAMNLSFAKDRTAAKTHVLQSRPETIHWGFFDGALEPVLTVDSGDRVVVECVSGNAEWMPAKSTGFEVLPELEDIHRRAKRGTGNHILTGPIFVRGAATGDVLEVRILDIELRQIGATTCSGPTEARFPRTSPITASSTSRSIKRATWLFCLPG
jgi:Acetamidase/Formamidase family